jgi:pimeloyl-ACP methyl ester carboxylesterase
VLRARTLADPVAGPLLRELQLSTLDHMAARMTGALNDITQSRLPFACAVEQIVAPVLIVHGTADQAVPFEQADSLAHRLRGSEVLAIEGGEHVSLFTRRDLIQCHVTQFLERHLGLKITGRA